MSVDSGYIYLVTTAYSFIQVVDIYTLSRRVGCPGNHGGSVAGANALLLPVSTTTLPVVTLDVYERRTQFFAHNKIHSIQGLLAC